MEKITVEIINELNKKRKNDKKYCKNSVKNVNKRQKTKKISYKPINTTNFDMQLNKMLQKQCDIYSYKQIQERKSYIIQLSKYNSQKINSQILPFRSAKTQTIVEIIAKNIISDCFAQNIYNIDKYINNKYSYLYKKEFAILPYLLIDNLFCQLLSICDKMNQMYVDIQTGAKESRFYNYQKYSLAKIYGIAKYNDNLLKYIKISGVNIKKCVFCYIKQLNMHSQKVDLLFKMIDNILPYTSIKCSSR